MHSIPPEYIHSLLSLWKKWQTQAHWPALDRWLKRELAGRPDALVLGAAMHQAMRFLQLAAALEHAYRTNNLEQDWLAWDEPWQPHQGIPPLAFWYWVMLRLNEDKNLCAPPPGLRDADARQAFFAEFARGLSPEDDAILQPRNLLWFGLRPQWAPLLEERQRASGWSQQQLASFIRQQVMSPPLWLRVSPGGSAHKLAQELLADGVKAEASEQGLCARGGADVTRTQAHREGKFEIQDLASQQLAMAVNAKPGDKVWDACAGAGGKSLAIAAPMNNKGMLLATDLHAYKLDELKRRAKRAGLFNIRSFTWTGDAPLQLPKEIARQGGFDWVLVDAPCTSSGTWRRNPDARWRFSAKDSAELQQLQSQLINNAAVAVRPGGYLVYGTCSWQWSENESRVEEFIAQHPEFTCLEQKCLGAPHLDADSLFVAVLRKDVAQ